MSVTMRTMTEEEFDIFRSCSIASQAEERMKEYMCFLVAATNEAEAEFAQLLPEGLRTPNHTLMVIHDGVNKELVGYLWTLYEVTEGKKQSFLCDFIILESKRRQGYGTAALQCMEEKATEDGCQESVLFVSDRNEIAKQLYQKCGYQSFRMMIDGAYMKKQL